MMITYLYERSETNMGERAVFKAIDLLTSIIIISGNFSSKTRHIVTITIYMSFIFIYEFLLQDALSPLV
jgi:hypothetical protein